MEKHLSTGLSTLCEQFESFSYWTDVSAKLQDGHGSEDSSSDANEEDAEVDREVRVVQELQAVAAQCVKTLSALSMHFGDKAVKRSKLNSPSSASSASWFPTQAVLEKAEPSMKRDTFVCLLELCRGLAMLGARAFLSAATMCMMYPHLDLGRPIDLLRSSLRCCSPLRGGVDGSGREEEEEEADAALVSPFDMYLHVNPLPLAVSNLAVEYQREGAFEDAVHLFQHSVQLAHEPPECPIRVTIDSSSKESERKQSHSSRKRKQPPGRLMDRVMEQAAQVIRSMSQQNAHDMGDVLHAAWYNLALRCASLQYQENKPLAGALRCHSQQELEQKAQELVARLGCKLMLSKSVLCYAQPQGVILPDTEDSKSDSSSSTVVLDNVLQPVPLQHLQSVFDSDSVFWKEHHYPSSSFFSYYYPLEHTPGSSVEELIQALRPCVARGFPELASRIVGAEWWVHSRDHSGGHQMHFDLDEQRLLADGQVHHPLVSSVLYLSAEESGGPTLITDHSCKDGGRKPATKGWLVFPKLNRFVMFDGSLLHGVIPGRFPGKVSRRLTLMIGWWGPPGPTYYDGTALTGPAMLPPWRMETDALERAARARLAALRREWGLKDASEDDGEEDGKGEQESNEEDEEDGDEDEDEEDGTADTWHLPMKCLSVPAQRLVDAAAATVAHPPLVSPVWEAVRPLAATSEETDSTGVTSRFFLRSHQELLDALLGPASAPTASAAGSS